MREVVRFATEEALPSLGDVLRAQGLPEEETLAPRLRALVDEALAAYAGLAEPVGVCEDASAEAVTGLLAPLAVASDALVLGRVCRRAEALALYVATLGERLPARIRELFAEGELAQGYMLDAVASAGADLLSERLSRRFAARLEAGGDRRVFVLPYSPGYCGWPTAGQRPLFARLRPEEIGVTLNDSCLMSPIKSVSGVLVGGAAEAHRFRPDFPFCAECRNRECGRRMASLRSH